MRLSGYIEPEPGRGSSNAYIVVAVKGHNASTASQKKDSPAQIAHPRAKQRNSCRPVGAPEVTLDVQLQTGARIYSADTDIASDPDIASTWISPRTRASDIQGQGGENTRRVNAKDWF